MKGQSRLVIASSLRNIYKYSVFCTYRGSRYLEISFLETRNTCIVYINTQTLCVKAVCLEGNSPDRYLKFLIVVK